MNWPVISTGVVLALQVYDAVPAADAEPFDNMPPVDESASLMHDEETNEWSYANETSALTYDEETVISRVFSLAQLQTGKGVQGLRGLTGRKRKRGCIDSQGASRTRR